MQISDEVFAISIILAGQCLLVKMLILVESDHIFDQILHTYTFFEMDREITKKKNHAWIRTTVCLAVGIQESLLDYSHPLIVYILEEFKYISFTCAGQNLGPALSCADPESFVRGSPLLTKFSVLFNF